MRSQRTQIVCIPNFSLKQPVSDLEDVSEPACDFGIRLSSQEYSKFLDVLQKSLSAIDLSAFVREQYTNKGMVRSIDFRDGGLLVFIRAEEPNEN